MCVCVWAGSPWSTNCQVSGLNRPAKIPTEKVGNELESAAWADTWTTRPMRQPERRQKSPQKRQEIEARTDHHHSLLSLNKKKKGGGGPTTNTKQVKWHVYFSKQNKKNGTGTPEIPSVQFMHANTTSHPVQWPKWTRTGYNQYCLSPDTLSLIWKIFTLVYKAELSLRTTWHTTWHVARD